MKIKNIFKTAFIALFITTIYSCSDDDDTTFGGQEADTSIAAFVSGSSDYSSLLAALQKAELVETLSGEGNFTVFAPNDDAFAEFLGDTPLDDVPADVLKEILLNHVLGKKATATDLSTGYESNLAGFSTYVNKTDDGGVTINGDIEVTSANIDRSNGVIHAVNKVIAQPTLLTFVTADPNLSSLATVATDNSATVISELGKDGGSLTLLAPDNAAFTDLGDISGLTTAQIEQVLLNHAITGSLQSTDLSTGYGNTLATYGTTTNNLSIYINTADGVVFNGISTVTTANVVATNGVMHIVDKVITLPTVVTFAVADDNFSTLETALTTLTMMTPFEKILARTEGMNMDGFDPGFTVFAPTNAAFTAVGDLPAEGPLTTILLHHVIDASNIRSSDLSDGLVTPATLEGSTLTVTIPGTNEAVANLTDSSGNSDIEIIAVDVQASNGVIHAINKVLIPATPPTLQ